MSKSTFKLMRPSKIYKVHHYETALFSTSHSRGYKLIRTQLTNTSHAVNEETYE